MFNPNIFKGLVTMKGFTITSLADELKINPATLSRKLGRNGDFSREELIKMKNILNLSDNEMVDIFFN